MIKVQELTKTYKNGVTPLRGINLFIDSGEFVFIVGASGSGKSTLLKILLKEENITHGDVFVHGKSLKQMPYRFIPYYRRKIGIVFQDFRLIETMNVFDNVAFALKIVGTSMKIIRSRVLEVFENLKLTEKMYHFPRELSGGEKQRVGLARALVNKPSLIIADEPTGNVDPVTSLSIVRLLKDINSEGTTVLMVTHDLSIVSKFDFRTICIENSVIK